MKESMKVAKTVAWNLIPDEIKQKIYVEMKNNGNFGIHLHCPEAATPKDGPSAGCAITLAIVSLLTNTKIKNDVALTGEIDLGSIGEEFLMRLDSVEFPPEGCALLHTHQGPGIRCLREGSIRIDTLGQSSSYCPGGAWFENGSNHVFAQADLEKTSRFIRAMVLPQALLGTSSIKYVNEDDKHKPKSQSYRVFSETAINLVERNN
jgi:hypothetical protein